MSDLVH